MGLFYVGILATFGRISLCPAVTQYRRAAETAAEEQCCGHLALREFHQTRLPRSRLLLETEPSAANEKLGGINQGQITVNTGVIERAHQLRNVDSS